MKITIRIWILLIVAGLSTISIFSIPPIFLEEGLEVSNIDTESKIFEEGLRTGMIIQEINGERINSLEDYGEALDAFKNLEENETEKLIIKTKDLEI